MLKKTVSIILFFLLPVFGALGAGEDNSDKSTYRNLELFSNVLAIIEEHYVDPVEAEKVIRGAIKGMLGALDPHSAYMTSEDFKMLQEETRGSFSGVGLEITIRNDVLTVVAPIEDSPAFKQGVKAGDQIIRIDGEPAKSMSLMEAVKKLRGEKGEEVTISIHRKGQQKLLEITIVRDVIPLHSVKAFRLTDDIGFIRITNFQTATTADFLKELTKLSKKPAIKGLVFDLRDNPGGLLDQAVKIADIFLDEGTIVSTKGRGEDQTSVYKAQKDEIQYDFPIVVLVNEGSASASEIVAGALQDHRRAIIIGTETFGKGSVQTVIPMPEGAGLRLTTAKYYTPSGESIQATGIKPDIEVPFIPPAKDEKGASISIREKDLPNHFKNGDEDHSKEEKSRDTQEAREIKKRLAKDNQLRTALFILQGFILYEQETAAP